MNQWLNGHVVGHCAIPKGGDLEHDGKLLTSLVCEEHFSQSFWIVPSTEGTEILNNLPKATELMNGRLA